MFWLPILLMLMAAAWPQYRGPGGSGVAADSDNAPVEFGPTKHLLWKTAVPSGHSSPSIWGDRIFLGAFDKDSGKLEVLALDRRDGKDSQAALFPPKASESVHDISSPRHDHSRHRRRGAVYAYFALRPDLTSISTASSSGPSRSASPT